MSKWVGRLTISTTGNNKYFTLGSFLPTWANAYISADNSGSNDPAAHVCAGSTDGTNQSYEAAYKQGSNELYQDGTDRIIKHSEFNGTNFVTVVEAQFLAFAVIGGLNTIKMNVFAASTNYKVTIVCGN